MENKIIKSTEKRDIYIIKCDECGKEIKGTAESQVGYLLKQHKMAKHQEDN